MYRFATAIALLTTVCSAQTVYLTGIVRNASDQPLAGATVHLVKRNLTATSAANGWYVIQSGATRSHTAATPAGNAWRVEGHRVQFAIARTSQVRARLFDLRGRALETVLDARINPGPFTLDLRRSVFARQALLLRVECDGVTESYQLPLPTPSSGAPRLTSEEHAGALTAEAAVVTLDTLRATSGASTIKLFVYSYIDTMNFWLGESSSLSEARQQCVHRINYYRSTVGLGPLARRKDKETCVDGQAQSDAASGTAHGAFGACSESSQDECPRWNSVLRIYTDCLQMMWDEGPPPVGEPCNYPSACYTAHGHYINMTGNYSGVACGFYTVSSTVHWGTQDLW